MLDPRRDGSAVVERGEPGTGQAEVPAVGGDEGEVGQRVRAGVVRVRGRSGLDVRLGVQLRGVVEPTREHRGDTALGRQPAGLGRDVRRRPGKGVPGPPERELLVDPRAQPLGLLVGPAQPCRDDGDRAGRDEVARAGEGREPGGVRAALDGEHVQDLHQLAVTLSDLGAVVSEESRVQQAWPVLELHGVQATDPLHDRARETTGQVVPEQVEQVFDVLERAGGDHLADRLIAPGRRLVERWVHLIDLRPAPPGACQGTRVKARTSG
ncbi:hypothetical protein JN535_00045 [Cellulosimicrobium cellulans]|uniref:hypothetical protein n=1 Tax=Cellulosimicrobium cellulans TaxID=1710 RepID=UPI0019655B68|nr:hypothetical protein [Cellulosimicrobium cellulans]MBN0038563.1 hypothetical protein [Cellulosimicrobium cellulans]